MFIEKHLNYLKNINLANQGRVGRNIRTWGLGLRSNYQESGTPLLGKNITNELPDHSLSRLELREFCRGVDVEVAFIAIAAWGGMNLRHGTSAWEKRCCWKSVLQQLKGSNKTRHEDYSVLHKLRISGDLPGVGIPYFTKLLFFLRQNDDAYIMDQWTAKSINLLTGKPVVRVNKYNWVTDDNGSDRYKLFCEIIDHLAVELGCDGNHAETALMSRGGHRPEPWRRYVVSNYVYD